MLALRQSHPMVYLSLATERNPAGCSKSPRFSPTQPRRLFHPPALSLPRQTLRPGTRLVPGKAAASCRFLRGGWDDPDCAQHSHPPTHRHAETCHLPGRGPSDSPTSPEGVGRLFFTARIERPPLYRGGSASKKNGLPAPSHSSEAARCASKGIVPATPFLFFSILLGTFWKGAFRRRAG